ncbi:hypothetical protein QBC45DRAFT_317198, partial [Copromyces sp. CBS 386.78]
PAIEHCPYKIQVRPGESSRRRNFAVALLHDTGTVFPTVCRFRNPQPSSHRRAPTWTDRPLCLVTLFDLPAG